MMLINFRVELGQLRLMLAGRKLYERRHVSASLCVNAFLIDVVEEREERIKLAPRDRVEFMIVAASAADRQAEEHRTGRLDAIDYIFNVPLFFNGSGFGDGAMIAVESSGDALVERRA